MPDQRGRTIRVTGTLDQYLTQTFGRETPRPGLQRVGRLYRALMADAMPAPTNVAVAGTNGKGSTVAALNYAFRCIGLRCMAFTSPHLLDVRERITVDGQPLSEEFWVESLRQLQDISLDLGISLSYFEAVFGVAVLACKRFVPDVALWEAGLGGRLDAINVIPVFDCVVVTSVGLDHCEILGDTPVQIAREKVALARRLTPLVLGDIEPTVVAELQPQLQAQRVLTIGADDPLPRAWLPHVSALQARLPWLTPGSARAVVWCLVALDRWQASDIDWSQMPDMLGRMDRRFWPWIVDVGHNPDAARNLCRALRQQGWGELDLCFNALLRKDAQAMARELAQGFRWRRVWIYDDGGIEFHSPRELVEPFRAIGCRVDTINDPHFFAASAEIPTVVFGSFRLAALVMHELQEE